MLQNHIKNIHENMQNDVDNQESLEIRKRFNCDNCDFKTTSKTALTKHMSSKHKPKENKISKRKVCEICMKKFNKESTYNNHMQKQHKEGRSIISK